MSQHLENPQQLSHATEQSLMPSHFYCYNPLPARTVRFGPPSGPCGAPPYFYFLSWWAAHASVFSLTINRAPSCSQWLLPGVECPSSVTSSLSLRPLLSQEGGAKLKVEWGRSGSSSVGVGYLDTSICFTTSVMSGTSAIVMQIHISRIFSLNFRTWISRLFFNSIIDSIIYLAHKLASPGAFLIVFPIYWFKSNFLYEEERRSVILWWSRPRIWGNISHHPAKPTPYRTLIDIFQHILVIPALTTLVFFLSKNLSRDKGPLM